MIDFDAIKLLDICDFETSSSQGKYLVNYKERYFEVTPSVAELIHVLKKSDSLLEAAKKFSDERNREYSIEYLQEVVNRCIVPLISKEKKKKNSFIFKFEIFSKEDIDRFSDAMKFLFNAKVMIPLVLITLFCDVMFLWKTPLMINYMGKIDLYILLITIALFIASMLIHELGHASACKYYKVSHGGIGLGLYINIPVFYTDVSNVWKLNRKQRIMVNFAGIYFQLILLVGFYVVYLMTHNEIARYFIIALNINFLFTLNPILKFDGYWIISDLLGVPNLRERAYELIPYIIKRFQKRQNIKTPFLFSMKSIEKRFMVVYSIFMNIFMIFFLGYFLPRFMYNFVVDILPMCKKIIEYLAEGIVPYYLIQTVFPKLLLFVLTMYFLLKLIIPFIKIVFKQLFQNRQISIPSNP